MSILLGRHVFGCERGYRTLATSHDLGPAEVRELETYSFGQTDDRRYLESLDASPAYWCRPLRSGRVGITRVLAGEPDDKGRSTLLLITVVVSKDDWTRCVDADATELLRAAQLWKWNGDHALDPKSMEVLPRLPGSATAETRERVLSMLAAVEALEAQPGTTVVATESEFPPDEFRWLVRVLPAERRATFSYAVRSLSDGLPVTVNCLADGVTRGRGGRETKRWTPEFDYAAAPYTATLAYFWQPGKGPPWEYVANCRTFGQARKASPPRTAVKPSRGIEPISVTASRPRRRRYRLSWPIVLAVILIGVVGVTGYLVNEIVTAKRQREALIADVHAFLASHPMSKVPMLAARESVRRKSLKEGESLRARIEGAVARKEGDAELASLLGQMKEWVDRASAEDDVHARLSRIIAGFEDFKHRGGLPKLSRTDSYPTAQRRTEVDGWRARLEAAKAEAEQLGEPYLPEVDAALAQIRLWSDSLAMILDQCERDLREAEAFFGQEPPDRLSNDVVEETQRFSDLVDNLLLRVEHASGKELAGREAALNVQKCLRKRDEWVEDVEERKSRVREDVDRARGLIRQDNLDLTPREWTQSHLDSWKAAQDALGATDKALSVWEDHEEACSQQKLVKEWVKEASNFALKEFRRRVAAAKPEDGARIRSEDVRKAREFWNNHEAAICSGNNEPECRELDRQLQDLEDQAERQGLDDADAEDEGQRNQGG